MVPSLPGEIKGSHWWRTVEGGMGWVYRLECNLNKEIGRLNNRIKIYKSGNNFYSILNISGHRPSTKVFFVVVVFGFFVFFFLAKISHKWPLSSFQSIFHWNSMTSNSCGCIIVNTPIFQTLWEEPIKLHVQLSMTFAISISDIFHIPSKETIDSVQQQNQLLKQLLLLLLLLLLYLATLLMWLFSSEQKQLG